MKIINIDKIVYDYQSGNEWSLEDYPSSYQSTNFADLDSWGVNEVNLQQAKVLANELTDYEFEIEIEEAKDFWELQDALEESPEYKRDNSYNQSWWGGVIDFGVLGGDYDKALCLVRFHIRGDVRGNYTDIKAFEMDSYLEEFPMYRDSLTYLIETDKGRMTLDSDDWEGYSFNVVEDETGTFEEGDYIKLDELEDKFNTDDVDLYNIGGAIAIEQAMKMKQQQQENYPKSTKALDEAGAWFLTGKRYAKGGSISDKDQKFYDLVDMIMSKDMVSENTAISDAKKRLGYLPKYSRSSYAKGGSLGEFNIAYIDAIGSYGTNDDSWDLVSKILSKHNIQVDNSKDWHTKGYAEELIEFRNGQEVITIKVNMNDAPTPKKLKKEISNLPSRINYEFTYDYAKGGSVKENLDKADSHLREVGTKLYENKNIRERAFRKEKGKFDDAMNDLLPNRYVNELGYAKGGIIEIEGFGKYKEVDGEIKVGDMAISENGMLNEYVDEDDDLYFINETHTKVIPIEEYAKGGMTSEEEIVELEEEKFARGGEIERNVSFSLSEKDLKNIWFTLEQKAETFGYGTRGFQYYSDLADKFWEEYNTNRGVVNIIPMAKGGNISYNVDDLLMG